MGVSHGGLRGGILKSCGNIRLQLLLLRKKYAIKYNQG
jgi:hypothetical protein